MDIKILPKWAIIKKSNKPKEGLEHKSLKKVIEELKEQGYKIFK